MQPQAPAAPTHPFRPAFLNRRELFCQHYAAGAGGAEAVRRAGYSPNGAKQRAFVLLTQPEIRLRIEALRAERRSAHARHLTDAIATVDGIIADAVQHSKSSVALRAVEFKLKLHGVIRDKRIDHYSYSDKPSPDADLEVADCLPDEELDGLPGYEYVLVPPDFTLPPGYAMPLHAKASAPVPSPTPVAASTPAESETVTNDDPDTAAPAGDLPAEPAAVAMTTATGAERIAPRTSSAIITRRRHASRNTGKMTSDDLAAACPNDPFADLIAGWANAMPALPPETRPS
jgi:hypothetical protein